MVYPPGTNAEAIADLTRQRNDRERELMRLSGVIDVLTTERDEARADLAACRAATEKKRVAALEKISLSQSGRKRRYTPRRKVMVPELESFQDAVRNDPDMTSEQKEKWLRTAAPDSAAEEQP